MTKILLFTFSLLCLGTVTLAQNDQKETKKFQHELDKAYKSKEGSPLPEGKRKKFKGHDFFPIDMKYKVVAKFTRASGAEPFQMKTSTDRLPDYVVYGVAEFELDGRTFQLNIYQSIDLSKTVKYRKHLFLPFTDLTSGGESYGGGRYIDLEIPEGDTIVIDFNRAYNPYCAYSGRYSCPIPPVENSLDTAIKAGVKTPH